jgi:hypothetical protein
MRKRTLLLLIAVVPAIGMQFFRPVLNEGELYGKQHINQVIAVPADIESTLKVACYDCHSNHTSYPWYSKVQPAAWWLSDHVTEGKDELNFSVFAAYQPKRQRHKLEEIAEQVKAREMPLKSYELVHPVAVLSEEQIKTLADWALTARNKIQE